MRKFRFLMCLSVIVLTMLGMLSLGCLAAEDTSDFSVASVSAVNSLDGATIKWKKAEGAESYVLYRAEGSGKFRRLIELPAESLSYKDTSVKSGESYRYKAVPVNSSEEGTCKKEASLIYLAAPTQLKAANSPKGVKISWKKSEGADSYTIYRKLPSESSWSHAGFVGNTSSFVDQSVESATDYIYTVRAKISKKTSSNYIKEGVSVKFVSTPELKSIANTANGIKISWNKVDNTTSYILYRRTAGASWTKLTQLDGKKTKYTDTTAQPKKGYAYTVRAVIDEDISSFYSGLSYRYIPVVKVTSAKNDAEGLLVSWQKSPYATGYKLYRKAADDTSWKRIATVKGQGTVKYTDKKVASGEQYTYTVIAVNGKSQSTFDKTGKAVTYVAAPKNVSFTLTNTKNTVKWEKVTGATHYYIYRKSETESSWTKLARTKVTNSYVDSTAKASVIYFYCVKAGINGKHISAFSKQVRSSNIDPSKKMIALTYDDGPSSSTTHRILDVLEKHNAKATFFVVGSRVDSYSDALVRAHKLGCQIGNHTYTHINLPSYSDSSIRSEISKTDEVVKKYTGIAPAIARAPGGSTNKRVLNAAGKPFIHWSVDTRDWEHRNASRTVSIIKNNVRDGSIILMHDLYPATASASETVIPWLINQGYQLVTVSELMQYRGIDMRSGYVYYNGYKK